MKRIIRIVFLFLCVFLTSINNVHAEDKTCNNDSKNKLSRIASQVQVDYSIKKEKDQYVIYTTIYNITKDITVSYTSDLPGSVYGTVTYKMTKNGSYTFANVNTTDIEELRFTVHNVKGVYGCEREALRSFKKIKPKYNKFHDYDICKYEKVEDFYYCKQWITSNFRYTDKQVVAEIEKELQKSQDNDKIKDDFIDPEEIEEEKRQQWSKEKKEIITVIIILMVLDLVLMTIQYIRIKRSEI